jgi:hypothetical protein
MRRPYDFRTSAPSISLSSNHLAICPTYPRVAFGAGSFPAFAQVGRIADHSAVRSAPYGWNDFSDCGGFPKSDSEQQGHASGVHTRRLFSCSAAYAGRRRGKGRKRYKRCCSNLRSNDIWSRIACTRHSESRFRWRVHLVGSRKVKRCARFLAHHRNASAALMTEPRSVVIFLNPSKSIREALRCVLLVCGGTRQCA